MKKIMSISKFVFNEDWCYYRVGFMYRSALALYSKLTVVLVCYHASCYHPFVKK